jgi:GNAT superfamily N-acetyltransferase
MIAIQQIMLPVPGIEDLRREATQEGYRFLETLAEEWVTGKNRFDGQGEMLCGVFDSGLLIALGGLNLDRFVAEPDVGRIRRVYVRPGWRNRGIGEALVTHLVEHARRNFCLVRLRAESIRAGRLYERIGFSPCNDPHATHTLRLDA